MKIVLELDDAEILQATKEIATQKLADELFNKTFATYQGNVLRSAYRDICREVIYAEKDKIIDRVVAQATAEVKRKSIQRILAMVDEEDSE